jgi:hypothetical protein
MGNEIERRWVLSGLGLGGLAGAAGIGGGTWLGLGAAEAKDAAMPDMASPQANLEAIVKLMASQADEVCPWWYTGKIYAAQEKKPPVLMYAFEGTEIYWPRKQADGSWFLRGKTMTFYRDKDSHEYIDSFANPFTGKTVTTKPNVLGGRGHVIYATDGMRFSFAPDASPRKPLKYEWQRVGDIVYTMKDRAFPGAPAPSMEVSTTFASLAEFADPKVKNANAWFSSTTFSPYPAWLDMGDTPGHLVWHASGRKMKSFDAMPKEFTDRLAKVFGPTWSADPWNEG